MKYIVLIAAFVLLFATMLIGEKKSQPPARYVEEVHEFCVDEGIERVFGDIDEIPNWEYLKYMYYLHGGIKHDPALQHLFRDFKGTADIVMPSPPPPPPGEIHLSVRFFLQGYYLGDGMMRQAHEMKSDGSIAPRWRLPISDLCSIRIHDYTDYDNILHAEQTFLTTDGYAHIIVPDSIMGHTTYVSIKHRNHIETVHIVTTTFEL